MEPGEDAFQAEGGSGTILRWGREQRAHRMRGGGLVSQMVAKGGSAIARSASQKWGVVRSQEDFEQDDDKL